MDATRRIVLVIADRVTSADVPRLCEELTGLLDAHDAQEVDCDVGALGAPDLAAVDAVARLRLTARRRGRVLRLRNPTPALLALLELVGLHED